MKVKYPIITIYFLLLAVIIAITAFLRSDLILQTNDTKMIEKAFHKPMKVVNSIDYLYLGKKYKIILATGENKKDELYLQCFEEKVGGLFYKTTYGASQGKSTSLYGMTAHFLNGSNNKFLVVYGYNKNLMGNSYSVKSAQNDEWITHDISKEEYFLQVYTDIVYPKVIFKDGQENDIIREFIGN